MILLDSKNQTCLWKGLPFSKLSVSLLGSGIMLCHWVVYLVFLIMRWSHVLEGSLGGGNGNPLQCSHLDNSMDRGTWWATASVGCKESDMTEWKCGSFCLFISVWMCVCVCVCVATSVIWIIILSYLSSLPIFSDCHPNQFQPSTSLLLPLSCHVCCTRISD